MLGLDGNDIGQGLAIIVFQIILDKVNEVKHLFKDHRMHEINNTLLIFMQQAFKNKTIQNSTFFNNYLMDDSGIIQLFDSDYEQHFLQLISDNFPGNSQINPFIEQYKESIKSASEDELMNLQNQFNNLLEELASIILPLLDKLNEFKRDPNLKICCFCEEKNANNMWSLYADANKGFCIEYDYHVLSSEVNNKLYNVVYSDDRPMFPFEQVIKLAYEKNIVQLEELIKQMYHDVNKIKAIRYEKENEWRIVLPQAENVITTKSIKAIYLGSNISKWYEDRIKKIAREKNIKVYKTMTSINSFDFNFELV